MAKFVRGKVKGGEYANLSAVVRDALRRWKEAEAAKKEPALLAGFEAVSSKRGVKASGAGCGEGSRTSKKAVTTITSAIG
jgi:putative addiction module CopG family antidote